MFTLEQLIEHQKKLLSQIVLWRKSCEEFCNEFNLGKLLRPEDYKFSKYSDYIKTLQDDFEFYGVNLSAKLQLRGVHTEIYITFIDNADVEAEIHKCPYHSNRYYILITSGLYFRVEALYAKLSQNITVSLSGGPIKEYFNLWKNKPIKTITGINWQEDLEKIITIQGDHETKLKILRDIVEECHTTATLNNFPSPMLPIASMITDCVLNHELAHLAHGHLDYLHKNYGINSLSEVSYSEKFETPESQALELIADLRSWEYIGRHISLGGTPNVYIDLSEHEGAPYDGPLHLFLLSFGITVLYSLFDASSAKHDAYIKKRHPHPEFRMLSFFEAVNGSLSIMSPHLENEYNNMLFQGFFEAIRGLERGGMSGRFFPHITNREAGYVGDLHSPHTHINLPNETINQYYRLKKHAEIFDLKYSAFHLPILTALKEVEDYQFEFSGKEPNYKMEPPK